MAKQMETFEDEADLQENDCFLAGISASGMIISAVQDSMPEIIQSRKSLVVTPARFADIPRFAPA